MFDKSLLLSAEMTHSRNGLCSDFRLPKYETSSGNSFRSIVRSNHRSSKVDHGFNNPCLTNWISSMPWSAVMIFSKFFSNVSCLFNIHNRVSNTSFFRFKLPLTNWPITDNFKLGISRLKFSSFGFSFGQLNNSRNRSSLVSVLYMSTLLFMKRLRKVGRNNNDPIDFDTYFMVSRFEPRSTKWICSNFGLFSQQYWKTLQSNLLKVFPLLKRPSNLKYLSSGKPEVPSLKDLLWFSNWCVELS